MRLSWGKIRLVVFLWVNKWHVATLTSSFVSSGWPSRLPMLKMHRLSFHWAAYLKPPDTYGIYSSGLLLPLTRTDVLKPHFVSADADKGDCLSDDMSVGSKTQKKLSGGILFGDILFKFQQIQTHRLWHSVWSFLELRYILSIYVISLYPRSNSVS